MIIVSKIQFCDKNKKQNMKLSAIIVIEFVLLFLFAYVSCFGLQQTNCFYYKLCVVSYSFF